MLVFTLALDMPLLPVRLRALILHGMRRIAQPWTVTHCTAIAITCTPLCTGASADAAALLSIHSTRR